MKLEEFFSKYGKPVKVEIEYDYQVTSPSYYTTACTTAQDYSTLTEQDDFHTFDLDTNHDKR